MRIHHVSGVLLLGPLLALAGCSNAPPEGCDYYVTPGGDDQTAIQEALVSADDNQTVCLGAGTFRLTDPLEISNRTGFTLRGDGMNTTTLDFSAQAAGGTGVDMMNMTNLLVEDLGILDSSGNGLRVQGGNGVVIRRVKAGWTAEGDADNGRYAIYPVSSTNVLVENSEAYGSSDAGFYIGQVTNCIMRNNVAHGNVAAYEVENSTNCEVYGNMATDNTGGFLVFELPNLPMRGTGTLFHDNTATGNNRANFADPGSIIALLPQGTGFFVLGANDVEIRDNTIDMNNGTGTALLSYTTALALQGQTDTGDPGYDPWMETVNVHDNTYTNNGTSPGGTGPDGGPDSLGTLLVLMMAQGLTITTLEDISWDGFLKPGDGPDEVCLRNNGAATFRNLDVPNIQGATYNSTTDASPHDCTHPARPAVDDSFADFAAPAEG